VQVFKDPPNFDGISGVKDYEFCALIDLHTRKVSENNTLRAWKPESRHLNARQYASGLAANGRCDFTSREVQWDAAILSSMCVVARSGIRIISN
jgi:hypothetical protein